MKIAGSAISVSTTRIISGIERAAGEPGDRPPERPQQGRQHRNGDTDLE